MAKKSATKTSQKKTTTKKQAQEKKTQAPKKKTAAKSPSKAKSTQKGQTAAKKRTGKASAQSPKPLTTKELLEKRFEAWKPQSSYKPQPDEAYKKAFSAPPFFPDQEKTDAEALKALLFKRFDVEPAAAPETPAPAEKAEEAPPAAAEPAPAPEAKAEPAQAPEVEAEPVAQKPEPAPTAPPAQKAAAKPPAETPEAPPAETEPAPPQEKAAPEPPAGTPEAAPAKAEPAAPPTREAPAPPRVAVGPPKEPAKEKPAPSPKPPAAPEPPPTPKEEMPSMNRTAIAVIAGFALLLLILLGVSYSNTSNYYVKAFKGGIEIWKGKFAPMGAELLIQLPGFEAPAEIQPVYTQEEVYPMIARHFMNQADRLLQAEEVPDLAAIKVELEKADAYATGELEDQIENRLKGIDLIVLIYRAEVAGTGGTPEALANALGYLEEAEDLAMNEFQEEMIAKRTAAIQNQLAAIQAAAPPAAEEAGEAAQTAPTGEGEAAGPQSPAHGAH